MKLEEAIKQKRFKSEHQKAILNVMFTGSWLNAGQSCFLKEYGITPQQYNVLRILRGQYPSPSSIQLITERMLDKMSNASRLVEKLRQRNLVDRKLCSQNRRKVDVLITNEGRKLAERIMKDYGGMKARFPQISKDEAKELNRILDKLRS